MTGAGLVGLRLLDLCCGTAGNPLAHDTDDIESVAAGDIERVVMPEDGNSSVVTEDDTRTC